MNEGENTVFAKVLDGNYKDGELVINLGRTGKETEVWCNSADISNKVKSLQIEVHPDRMTTLKMEMIKRE